MLQVRDFFSRHGKKLSLNYIDEDIGMKKYIREVNVQTPGLGLSDFIVKPKVKFVMVFGKKEADFTRKMDRIYRRNLLEKIISIQAVVVISAQGFSFHKELIDICKKHDTAIFKTNLKTEDIVSQTVCVLTDELALTATYHGTLIEVYGVGVLIQGDSSAGKSEAALGLIEKGHRLISDDVVKIKRKSYLEGSGSGLTRYHMEIRGLGIINVGYLYGAVCVRDTKSIDVVVTLEMWNQDHHYDRTGLDEKHVDILGIRLPHLLLPLKPGRDTVLLIETIALNYRLKQMGHNSAEEFNSRLLNIIKKNKK